MRRRDFIAAIIGSATEWPLVMHAQQAMPVIGFLNAAFAAGYRGPLSAFLKGLAETGYTDGQNVTIQYRWAEGHYDRLPNMAAYLVRNQVTVIAATSTPAALAAKAATSTIPIVFETGGDPIKLGLVTSLNRPGSNVTGAASLATEVMVGKGLELLHELIPAARVVGLLVDPNDPAAAEPQEREVLRSARTLGLEIRVLKPAPKLSLTASLRSSRNCNYPHCSSVRVCFSRAMPTNSGHWQPDTQSRPSMHGVSSLQPEDC
jgi:putative ABC transport system substrate-binding protein